MDGYLSGRMECRENIIELSDAVGDHGTAVSTGRKGGGMYAVPIKTRRAIIGLAAMEAGQWIQELEYECQQILNNAMLAARGGQEIPQKDIALQLGGVLRNKLEAVPVETLSFRKIAPVVAETKESWRRSRDKTWSGERERIEDKRTGKDRTPAQQLAHNQSMTRLNTGWNRWFNSGVVEEGVANEEVVYFVFSLGEAENHTDICLAREGWVISTNDPELAVNTPPLHWNCRSRLLPVTREAAKKYEIKRYTPPDAKDDENAPADGFGGYRTREEWKAIKERVAAQRKVSKLAAAEPAGAAAPDLSLQPASGIKPGNMARWAKDKNFDSVHDFAAQVGKELVPEGNVKKYLLDSQLTRDRRLLGAFDGKASTVHLSLDTAMTLRSVMADPAASQSSRGYNAVTTLIHENIHSTSENLRRPNSGGYSFIEEGITERKARKIAADFMFEGTTPWHVSSSRTCYSREVRGVDWFAERFGENSLEDIWKTSSNTERFQKFSAKVREHLRPGFDRILGPEMSGEVLDELGVDAWHIVRNEHQNKMLELNKRQLVEMLSEDYSVAAVRKKKPEDG